jgi:hypothetical protein
MPGADSEGAIYRVDAPRKVEKLIAKNSKIESNRQHENRWQTQFRRRRAHRPHSHAGNYFQRMLRRHQAQSPVHDRIEIVVRGLC